MAIKAYIGRMGNGKTYEVVSVVILEALRRGRRVVSNIAGLNPDEFQALLLADGVDVTVNILSVPHEDVLKPGFWLSDTSSDAILQPGDLLVLDEVWRFWEGFSGRKMPESVMHFFRMHRHFTHPQTGVACDVVLISQDIMDIARRVRAVIEETYRMEKLTAVGSSSRYRVDIFAGSKTSAKPLRSIQRTYEEKYFPLYTSHSQRQAGSAEAKEENIDQRGNILKGAIFRIAIPIGVLVLLGASFFLYKFFHPTNNADTTKQAKEKETSSKKTVANSPSAPPAFSPDGDWRVTGYVASANTFVVALNNGTRSRYLYNPPNVKMSNLEIETFLPGGNPVTTWSGNSVGQTKKSALPE